MASKQAVRYEIVSGPSKFDLMLALFDREGGNKIVLKIGEGEGSCRAVFKLQTVGRHGRSKEDWHITVDDDQRLFQGEYSTKTRKGFIESK